MAEVIAIPATAQGDGFPSTDGLHRPLKRIIAGCGFLFISHLGETMPSAFLPVPAGNVREAVVLETSPHLGSSAFCETRPG
ncbi:MAG: hypothetical protein WD906_06975 [Anaerolineales bacterium]